MKSYFVGQGDAVPNIKRASDFTSDERVNLREAFHAILIRDRRHYRFAILGVAGAVASLFFLSASHWMFIPFLLCILFAGVSYFSGPLLSCPSCSLDVTSGLSCFCPACGAESLKPRGYFGEARCDSCARILLRSTARRENFRSGRNRDYDIRFCTFCGLALDQEGV